MTYTFDKLLAEYANANIGLVASGADLAALQAIPSGLTDIQALRQVTTLSLDKTDVAVASYQFFAGIALKPSGLSYIVNGTTNPNDLTSPYYAPFNTESRYESFALNVAGAPGSTFVSAYGSLTFAQAVAKAYDTIIGLGNVTPAYAAQAVAYITSEQPYFAQVATRNPDLAPDLGTKAAMAGYVLYESIRADLGTYAQGLDSYMATLAVTGAPPAGGLLSPPSVPAATFLSGMWNAGPTSYGASPQMFASPDTPLVLQGVIGDLTINFTGGVSGISGVQNASIELDHVNGGNIVAGGVSGTLYLDVESASTLSVLAAGYQIGNGPVHGLTPAALVITGPGDLTANVSFFNSVDTSHATGRMTLIGLSAPDAGLLM